MLTVRWEMRPIGSITGGITKFSLVHLIHFVVMFLAKSVLDCLYIYPSVYFIFYYCLNFLPLLVTLLLRQGLCLYYFSLLFIIRLIVGERLALRFLTVL